MSFTPFTSMSTGRKVVVLSAVCAISLLVYKTVYNPQKDEGEARTELQGGTVYSPQYSIEKVARLAPPAFVGAVYNPDPQNSIENDMIPATNEERVKREVDNLMGTVGTPGHLVVFIHGYSNTEENMNTRIQDIDDALGSSDDVITTGFNWKWDRTSFTDVAEDAGLYETVLNKIGKIGQIGQNYDINQRFAKNCGDLLAQYVKQVIEKRGERFGQVTLIAHSMGCYLTCNAILSGEELLKKCNVIMVASDAGRKDYADAIRKWKGDGANKTDCFWKHIWSPHDNVLFASGVLGNSEWRSGHESCDELTKEDNIQWEDDLNFSAALKAEGGGHSYIDDVFSKDPNGRGLVLLEMIKGFLGL